MSAAGTFFGIDLTGYDRNPARATRKLIEKQRSGVDGEDLVDIGIHGNKSSLILQIDSVNASNNSDILSTLIAAIGAVDTIVMGSQTFTPFILLDVFEPKFIEMSAAGGGVVGGKFLLEIPVLVKEIV